MFFHCIILLSGCFSQPHLPTFYNLLNDANRKLPLTFFSKTREYIEISGCSRTPSGSYCSSSEDGRYLRQPPYDDIDGRPHYIKNASGYSESAFGARRHLFYSKQSGTWQISPVCNNDQGSFLYTVNSDLCSSDWKYMPPDQLENGNGFQFTYLGVQKPGSTLIYIPEEKQLKNKLGDLKSGGKTGGSRHPVDEIGFGGMDTRTVDEDEDVDEDEVQSLADRAMATPPSDFAGRLATPTSPMVDGRKWGVPGSGVVGGRRGSEVTVGHSAPQGTRYHA